FICDLISPVPVTRDIAAFSIAAIRELWIRLGRVSVASRGLAPLWDGMQHGCMGSVIAVIREP
ncbi:MAG: hypothetical protein PHQ34_08375, partial [Methanothrix sp.]|nr:hypothetical protein [Methanothrix sp.]